MKKITTIAALTLFTTSIFSQNEIIKNVDEMTDKVSYLVKESLVGANSTKLKGFVITPIIKKNDSGFEAKNLIVQISQLGNCNKDNTLIILFDNGEKAIISSWNKFNCKDVSYFDLDNKTIKKIKHNTIDKIRFTNGYTSDYFTATIEQKDYFISLFKLMKETNG